MNDKVICIGDIVTLYSFDNKDIIEFRIGDRSFPGLDRLCIGKRYKDIILYGGESFEVQYIAQDIQYISDSIKKNSINRNQNKTIKNKQDVKKNEKNESKIDIRDFIVRTTLNRCAYSNHITTPVNALVYIMNQGNIKKYSFPGIYCARCGKYYIYEHIYQEMKRKGYICCKVIKLSDLTKYEEDEKNNHFATWQDKSILNLYGYTVDKNKNLTNKERHQILAFIIENNILSTQKVANYLQGFITLRKNNKNMASAIGKWKDDINYVLNYKKTNRNIRINSLTVR